MKRTINSIAALLVFVVLVAAIKGIEPAGNIQEITANSIGQNLFGNFLLPFEVMALLLTAAAVGAIIIAAKKQTH